MTQKLVNLKDQTRAYNGSPTIFVVCTYQRILQLRSAFSFVI